jgi:hypothetical protein
VVWAGRLSLRYRLDRSRARPCPRIAMPAGKLQVVHSVLSARRARGTTPGGARYLLPCQPRGLITSGRSRCLTAAPARTRRSSTRPIALIERRSDRADSSKFRHDGKYRSSTYVPRRAKKYLVPSSTPARSLAMGPWTYQAGCVDGASLRQGDITHFCVFVSVLRLARIDRLQGFATGACSDAARF